MAGPNFNKLMIRRFSQLSVPDGGGLADVISVLSDPSKMKRTMTEAKKWTEEAIAVVKTAPDNPYNSDEEIAEAILNEIEKRLPPHIQRLNKINERLRDGS